MVIKFFLGLENNILRDICLINMDLEVLFIDFFKYLSNMLLEGVFFDNNKIIGNIGDVMFLLFFYLREILFKSN